MPGSSLGEASVRRICRCPERSRDPNGLPGPVDIKAGSNAAEPRLYVVRCQTPDVEADGMQPHCVFLYRRIVDPSGYFFF